MVYGFSTDYGLIDKESCLIDMIVKRKSKT